ncbi:hypothetical protein [Chlorogloea sp. CCALA 695]|nr:hypothetical protein [Chlorogloea sp. CCALA 695]
MSFAQVNSLPSNHLSALLPNLLKEVAPLRLCAAIAQRTIAWTTWRN